MDLWGPCEPAGLNGERFGLHFEEKRGRFSRSYATITKSTRALMCRWEQVVAWSKAQTGNDVKRITADGDFDMHEMKQWCSRNGVELCLTERDSSADNPIAERHGGTSQSRVHALMQGCRLPAEFWPLALETADHVKNRTPCRSKTGEVRTPYEIVYGCKPHIGNLKVFGCRMYAKIVPEPPKSARFTAARGVAGVMVGYADRVTGTNISDTHMRRGYKMYVEETGKIIHTRNARFLEDVRL